MQVSTAAETASKERMLTWYALPVRRVYCQKNASRRRENGGVSTLHAVLLLNLLCLDYRLLVTVVPYRDIGTCFCEGLCYPQSDACSCPRHDGGATFKGE